jgi:electron transfer flavoprotein beta subunit
VLDIVVLVKEVPDIEKVRFDTEKGRVDRSSAKAEINPFDLNALEAGAQIKGKLGGIITAISMGPPSAESTLREALARGADRAILVTGKGFAGADTLATSYTLASAVRKAGSFDLVICGEKTVDGDTGQVGPELAEQLNIPQITYASELVEVSEEKIVAVSEIGGRSYLVESKLPVLITVTKDINKPGTPSLRDRLKARESKVEIWRDVDALADVADVSKFGAAGSATRVLKVIVPSEKGRGGKIFHGDDAAAMLARALDSDGMLGE